MPLLPYRNGRWVGGRCADALPRFTLCNCPLCDEYIPGRLRKDSKECFLFSFLFFFSLFWHHIKKYQMNHIIDKKILNVIRWRS